MRAGVWIGDGAIECQDWPEPEVGRGLVVVDVAYCGLCGSDMHIVDGRHPAGAPPQVLGHEVSGTVSAVGEHVVGIEVGDRVACNLYGYCGACAWCRAGQPNHCRRKFFSAKGFAERAVYQADQVFVLPDEVDLATGAFVEPVATCLHALDLAGLKPGDNVAVLGGGAIGLILVQLAHLSGAASVTVSEPDASKRQLALEVGATLAVDPTEVDLLTHSRGVGGRRGFDVVFEASGMLAVASSAVDLVCASGRVVLAATYPHGAKLEISSDALFSREAMVRGSLAAGRTFARAVALLPRLITTPLISGIYPLERVADALAHHRTGTAAKLLVTPHEVIEDGLVPIEPVRNARR